MATHSWFRRAGWLTPWLLALTLTLQATGCANKDDAASGAAADLPCGAPAGDWVHVLSCDSTFGSLVHQCIDYYATSAAVSAVGPSFRSICQVQSGTVLEGNCPADGSIGSCTQTASNAPGASTTTAALERQYFYEGDASRAASFKQDCEGDRGIYTAPGDDPTAPPSSMPAGCSSPTSPGSQQSGVAFSMSTVVNGEVIECTNYSGEVSAAELESVLQQGAETSACPSAKALCGCPAQGVFGTDATLVYYQTSMTDRDTCPNDSPDCGPYGGP